MIFEILSTGDEISSGAVVDTNSSYIAQLFENIGIKVARHTCIRNNVLQMISVLKEIGQRADIAVVTGGLGPTSDDNIAEAAAKANHSNLVLNTTALDSIKKKIKNRQRNISKIDNKQAMLPDHATCIANPAGTAPGFILKINKCNFFFLPGVPKEIKYLFSDVVLPYIENSVKNKNYNMVKTLSLFGLPEAKVGESLKYFENRFKNIKIAYRAVFPIIFIKLYGQGSDKKKLADEIKKCKKKVINILGEWIFSHNGGTMEKEVGKLLIKNNKTVAVAESCTGGLIGNLLTDVPGSSEYFIFSGVTYSNESKVNILGVPEDIIIKNGAVHESTAIEMAECVRKISGADYGISTTGIAGPSGGTIKKPVGTVCIGISDKNQTKAYKYHFNFSDRDIHKKIFAITALNKLQKILVNQ